MTISLPHVRFGQIHVFQGDKKHELDAVRDKAVNTNEFAPVYDFLAKETRDPALAPGGKFDIFFQNDRTIYLTGQDNTGFADYMKRNAYYGEDNMLEDFMRGNKSEYEFGTKRHVNIIG